MESLPENPPTQPAGSTITFLPAPDSLTFMVPRTGFKGVALFFLIFALIWDGITFPMVIVFLLTFFRDPGIEEFFVLCFLSVFVLVGVLILLAAIQTAFRKAVLLASRDSLIYTQSGPIRNAEYQWLPADLKDIRTDYSGTTINDRRMRELGIFSKDGNKRGLFDSRNDDELEWIAATLRTFYNITSPQPEPDSELASEPASAMASTDDPPPDAPPSESPREDFPPPSSPPE